MIRHLACLLLLCLAAPAMATAGATDLAGRWALIADDTVLMTFTLARTSAGWAGSWERPARFETDGDGLSQLAGPAERRRAAAVHGVAGGLEMVVPDPAPARRDTPDRFVIRADDAATATLDWYGLREGPVRLVRVSATRRIGGWDAARTYRPAIHRPTDAEMTALFIADQAARQDPATLDWRAMLAGDVVRRAQTQALLDTGRLHSADDFYHAAYVFQHGDRPDDFLKAHALATIAVARGKPAAVWIAAATLDRYLQSIGQPQVYGTQYSAKGGAWSQEPYRRDLLSDAVRAATRVPPLADQAATLDDYIRREPTVRH